jgi:hypothetical protein
MSTVYIFGTSLVCFRGKNLEVLCKIFRS